MDRVVVSGAGPAGCVAARSAAMCGARVSVYEEHGQVGSPVQCAGLVSKKGLDSLGFGYSRSVLNRIRGADIHVGSTVMHVISPETKALVIDRAEFDSICALEAEGEGASIILGRRTPARSGGETLIGADGVFSRTAVMAGFPGQGDLVCCYQADFSNLSLESRDVVSVYVSRHAPGFFGWAIPINEEMARVGLGVSGGRNPKKHFESFASELEKGVLAGGKIGKRLAGFIPLYPRKQTVLGRTMLTGDAAGQVKAVSGGGVYVGCSCAAIAGRVASLEPENLGLYEKEWRGKFSLDLRTHQVMRGVLNFTPNGVLEALARAGKVAGLERFLVRYGDMDRPTEVARAVRNDSRSVFSKRFNSISSLFTNIFR